MNGAIPLTWAERSVWLASMLSTNPLSYNAACIVTIDGALSTQRLTGAIGHALRGAGLLSLRVSAEKGDLKWVADPGSADGVCLLDAGADAQSDPLDRLGAMFSAAPVRADSWPLVSAHVLRHRPDQHFVLLRHHHVLLDFQGAATLLNRAAEIYNGAEQPDAEDRRAEIALTEKAYLESDLYREDEQYWRDRMRGLKPGALANPAALSSSGERVDFTISRESFVEFAGVSRAIGSTPFQSVLLIACAHLQREREGDIVFGVPLAGRAAGGALNSQSRMLPFRIGFPPTMPRSEAAAAIRTTLKADIDRARFPIWENTEAIFAGERRGAAPRIALNFMRATSLQFGGAAATVSRMLYGERSAETYIRCVEEADGRLSMSLDSVRDLPWIEALGQALAAGVAAGKRRGNTEI